MFKELLKIAAAGLGAALAQVADLVMNGGALSSGVLTKILIGTVVVRIAMWVVAKFGPAPVPAP